MADKFINFGQNLPGWDLTPYEDGTPYLDTPAGSNSNSEQAWNTAGLIPTPPPHFVLSLVLYSTTQFALVFTGYTPGETKGFRVWTNWWAGIHYTYTIKANGTPKAVMDFSSDDADNFRVRYNEFNGVADDDGKIRLVFDAVLVFALISAIDIVDPFAVPTGPSIDTASPLPPQTAGDAIDIEIATSGGTGASVVSVHSGSALPTGIGGDAVTIVDNHLVGKAFAATYNFTLDATDEAMNVTSKAFVLVINPALGVIVCKINSRTAGTGGTPYPTLWQQKRGAIATIHNRGVGGQTWFGIIATDDEKAAILALYNPYAPFNILICWGGTNDAQAGYTGLQIYNQAAIITTYYEGQGWTVWVCYEIHRADFGGGGHATTVNPILDDFNARLAAVPLGSKQPRLHEIPQLSDLSIAKWSADGVHGTTDFYQIVAAYMDELLNETCDFVVNSDYDFGDEIRPSNISSPARFWNWYLKRGGGYSLVSHDIEPDFRPLAKWPNPNRLKLRRVNLAGEFQETENPINVNAVEQILTPEDYFAGFTFNTVPGMEVLAKVQTRSSAMVLSPASNVIDITDPPAAFWPTDIPEMRVYLPGSLTASDGDHVVLPDSSAHAQNMIQATEGHQPIFKENILDAKPVVRFDAVDDFYQLFNMSAFTEATFFFLIKRADEGVGGLNWWNTGGTEYPLGTQVYEDFGMTPGFDNSRFSYAQSAVLTNWHVYSCSGRAGADDTGIVEVYMNFFKIFTKLGVRFALNSGPIIGKNNADQFCGLDLAFFGVANKFLTPSERWNMDNWINSYWNLGI